MIASTQAILAGRKNHSFWTPDQIQTELWFDASDLSTLTLVSDKVSVWADKGRFKITASQSTDSQRPSVTSAYFNGLNALGFGASGWLNFSARIFQTEYISLWAVVDTTNIGSGYCVLIDTETVAGARTTPSIYIGKDKSPRINSGSGAVAVQPALTTAYFIEFILKRENIYSTQINGDVSTKVEDIGSGEYTLQTFSNISHATYTMSSILGETFVVATVLTDSIRSKIEGYLAHKWGLSGNLPITHPYKFNRPRT